MRGTHVGWRRDTLRANKTVSLNPRLRESRNHRRDYFPLGNNVLIRVSRMRISRHACGTEIMVKKIQINFIYALRAPIAP